MKICLNNTGILCDELTYMNDGYLFQTALPYLPLLYWNIAASASLIL